MRNTAWCRRDAGEFEFSKKVIVLCKRTLTLENLNENSRLVVSGSGEATALLAHSRRSSDKDLHLALPCGDDRVTGDQLREDTASCLDTKGEWADIDENDVRCPFSTGENTTLNSSTVSDSLVRVDALGRFLSAEVFFKELLNLRNTCRTSNKDNLS